MPKLFFDETYMSMKKSSKGFTRTNGSTPNIDRIVHPLSSRPTKNIRRKSLYAGITPKNLERITIFKSKYPCHRVVSWENYGILKVGRSIKSGAKVLEIRGFVAVIGK